MEARIILGIDPGSRHTGFALLSEEARSCRVSECGVIHTWKLDDQAARLQKIFESVTEIVKRCRPDFCAVETPVYGIDPLAMLKLGRAQAAAILAVTNQGIPVAEYYPKAVKKAVTGNGNASKEQVAWMLRKLVRLPEEPLSADASDAVAVAWCHLSELNGHNRLQSGRKYHQNNRKSAWQEFLNANPDKIRSWENKPNVNDP